jgi:hypothetical protein
MNFFREQPDFKGNPEHLKIIIDAIEKKDISQWNRWRETNNEIVPDLQGVYLCGDDFEQECLIGVNFSNADLKYSVFNKANLTEANFNKTNLYSSDFGDANLYKSDCRGATISETSLIHAHLKEADLRDADLQGSVIMGTDLEKALLHGVNVYKAQIIHCKVEGVKCDYVYIDVAGKERFPGIRNFRKGELGEILKKYREITRDITRDITIAP